MSARADRDRFAYRALPLLAALLLSVPSAARADFDRQAWSRYRAIDAARVAEAFRSGKTVSVELSEGLGHDTVRFGDDLRVVDQAGREVPFLLRPDRSRPETVSAAAINTVFRTGEQSFEIDPPAGAAAFGIELDIDTPAFSRQAELLSAAPGEATFQTVLREGVFHRGNGGPVLTSLTFPPQGNRRLRVVIRGGEEPLSIRAIRLRVASTVPRRSRAVPASFLGSDRDDSEKRSSIRFELHNAYPTDRLAVVASPAEFSRDALLYRETPAGETLVAGGTLHGRNGRGDDVEDGMPVPALERGRYRLEVDDGDSPPLRATGVAVYGPQLFLLFRPASALPHFLFHGHPAARPPVYDLGRILPDVDVVSALPASLGAEMNNFDFAGEKAQTALPERYPWLVRIASILIAILLGTIAWRALKNS